MGLAYEDLDDETRRFMIEEIGMDEHSDTLYRSPWLTQGGQGNWADILREAARNGNDDTLAAYLRSSGSIVATAVRAKAKGFGSTTYKVPHTAADTMACEFNVFFCRGLCARAVAQSIPKLEVYRAKEVSEPRSDSLLKIGLLVDPAVILVDLRKSHGTEPSFGIPPGPNTGISLRIPKSAKN